MWSYVPVLLSVLLLPCLGVDLTYTISEGIPSGTFIADIASDSDVPTNSSVKDRQNDFRFTQLFVPELITNNSQLFQVNPKTGRLFTNQNIDAEILCLIHIECYQLINIAVHLKTNFVKILEVKIIIQDINDHSPEFPFAEIQISFSEGDPKESRVLIPCAFDKDVDVGNSKIAYELQKQKKEDPFMMFVENLINGQVKLFISLTKSLDREIVDFYALQIIAYDMGSPKKETVLKVNITVDDINDNPPMFSEKIFNVSVGKLHQKSKAIFCFVAKDPDFGLNARIEYGFSSDTPNAAKKWFELNNKTGELFLSERLEETFQTVFQLFIEAKDQGKPVLSSIAKIWIEVGNERNNAPILDINILSNGGEGIVLFEDAAVGSFIAYLKVTDFDEGPKGQVDCFLQHEKFHLERIDIKKYKVVLKEFLDREEKDFYDLIIECRDKGQPSLWNQKNLSIQVWDVNDEQPQFSNKTFQFFVNENENSGFNIGFVNVSDSDLGNGSQLNYSLLTNNNELFPFQISQDGFLFTSESLDREFQILYKFQVLVQDYGSPSLSNKADIIVTVLDQNDNAPYFTLPQTNPHFMNVTYDRFYSNKIMQMNAKDDDSQENAFLRYQIIKGNNKNFFQIDPYSGLLSFNHFQANQVDKSVLYELEIIVKDTGHPVLSDTTKIILNLSLNERTFQRNNYPDVKIHFNLAIVIVIVSVTWSISIVLILTICYIKYSPNKNGEIKTRDSTNHKEKVDV